METRKITDKQKNAIKKLGGKITKSMTYEEAGHLITTLQKKKALTPKPQKYIIASRHTINDEDDEDKDYPIPDGDYYSDSW